MTGIPDAALDVIRAALESAYERLLAEELPTGTFGHAQPPPEGPRPWTALEQAEHLTALETALDGWHWQDDPRHLRVVRQQDAA